MSSESQINYVTEATPVSVLKEEYNKNYEKKVTHKITFSGVEGYDVYNISAPFVSNGKTYILGRVEKRNSEISKTGCFIRIDDTHYSLDQSLPFFEGMQDPFYTFLGDELVVGGTQIDTSPLDKNQIIGWRTIFFKGKSIDTLSFWTTGPHKMKDVRIAQWKDKYIVFARPQGGTSGFGKIAVRVADSKEQITPEFIADATVKDCHFIDGEWGGVNEPHLLKNGKIGIVGHISCRDSKMNLHYHSMAFVFDPETLSSSKIKIIAQRSDFAEGEMKRPDLKDVLFTGGLTRLPGGKARLYTGVSDCEAHFMEMDDPFTELENY